MFWSLSIRNVHRKFGPSSTPPRWQWRHQREHMCGLTGGGWLFHWIPGISWKTNQIPLLDTTGLFTWLTNVFLVAVSGFSSVQVLSPDIHNHSWSLYFTWVVEWVFRCSQYFHPFEEMEPVNWGGYGASEFTMCCTFGSRFGPGEVLLKCGRERTGKMYLSWLA